MNELVLSKFRIEDKQYRRMQPLFRLLDIPFTKGSNFWISNEGDLWPLYHDLCVKSRERLAQVHPDRDGSDGETYRKLSEVIECAKRSFHKRGIGTTAEASLQQLKERTERFENRNKPKPPTQIPNTRHCKFRECGNIFTPHDKRQIYCCTKHGVAEGNRRNYRKRRSYVHVYYRSCKRHNGCGRRFKTTHRCKLYCSKVCAVAGAQSAWRTRNREDLPVYKGTCPFCQAPFESTRERKTYCTPRCKNLARHARNRVKAAVVQDNLLKVAA